MKFSQIKGVDTKLSYLLKAARKGNIMHALLFDGPEGTGKRAVADIITRASLCREDGDEPCDVCPTCKKCLDGVHPDVHVVDLEEDRKQIRIEQVRSLIEKLSLASYEGGKKVVIIEHADTMNTAAQNALLKTLEEPVGDTLFILLTVSPGALLQTIRSRCLQVHFSALSPEMCAEALAEHGIERHEAELLSSLSAGCVGRALVLNKNGKFLQLREKVIDSVECIKCADDVPKAINTIGKVKDNEMGDNILSVLELWSWDLMRIQNGMPVWETDYKDKLLKSGISGNKLLRLITDAKQNRNVNVSWTNIIEPILFGIAEQVYADR